MKVLALGFICEMDKSNQVGVTVVITSCPIVAVSMQPQIPRGCDSAIIEKAPDPLTESHDFGVMSCSSLQRRDPF